MKFLVLALCVCAASAASFGNAYPRPTYQSQQVAKAAPPARAVVSPFAAPVVAANAAYGAAKVVAEAPVVAAKAVYNTAKDVATGKESEAAVVRSDSDVAADGFKYYYETSNGIAAQATGSTKKVGNDDVVAIQGSYRYLSPDGQVVEINYVADENGFQPQGDSIPVGPPVPEIIAKSLEYIREHPYKGEN